MNQPSDPMAAATHADPYRYYTELVAHRPVYRDDALGLWVAASADAVTAVLKSDLTRVRPAAEPVPRALLGSAAGEIFGQLVRMNDGAMHMRMKPGVSAKLTSLDPIRVAGQAGAWARHLTDELEPAAHAARITDFAFRLPVYVVASLLGVAPASLAQTASWVSDFVRCLAPASRPEQIVQGQAAAEHLAQQFRSLLGREHLDASVANTIGYSPRPTRRRPGSSETPSSCLAASMPHGRRQRRTPPSCTPSSARSCATIRRCRARVASWPAPVSWRARP